MVHMADNITGEIRAAWQTGTPLMNDRFKEQIEKVLNAKVGYAKRGRPKKRDKRGQSPLLEGAFVLLFSSNSDGS